MRWPQTREHIEQWIAWHLPHNIVSWAHARMVANAAATYPDAEVPSLTVEQTARAWDNHNPTLTDPHTHDISDQQREG